MIMNSANSPTNKDYFVIGGIYDISMFATLHFFYVRVHSSSIHYAYWCLHLLHAENTLLEKLVVYDLEKQVMGWRDYNCINLHTRTFSLLPLEKTPKLQQFN